MNILNNLIQKNIINKNIDTFNEFDLAFYVQYNKDNVFYIFKSLIEETAENKKFKEWLKMFKSKYKYLWEQGFCLTSKKEKNIEIFGYDAPGFPELERYEFKGEQFIDSDFLIKLITLDNKEIELFNNTKNGYDSIISAKNSVNTKKFIKKGKCPKCGCETYKVYIKIHCMGRKDLFQDQPCEEITEENWTNAFDWISVGLECSNCEHKIRNWFETETM